MPPTIVWPASPDSRMKSRMLQDTCQPMTREHMPRYDYYNRLDNGCAVRPRRCSCSQYEQAIKALQERLEETRKEFAPKPKFSFKSKSPSALSLSDAAEMAAEKRRAVPGGLRSPGSSFANTPASTNTPANEAADSTQDEEPIALKEMEADQAVKQSTIDQAKAASRGGRQSLSSSGTTVSITDQSNTHIILPSSSLRSQAPCTLQKITGSIVDLSIPTTATAPFAGLTINAVSSSLLLCGTVSGPAHVTKVKHSVLVIKCRQLRMHECENVDVYLHCTSRPIIEDCKDIRFTELPKFHVSAYMYASIYALPRALAFCILDNCANPPPFFLLLKFPIIFARLDN